MLTNFLVGGAKEPDFLEQHNPINRLQDRDIDL
jgi:hypothetical protein